MAEPGVLAALAAGVSNTTAPIVAFTDDDAVPRPDWIERIADALAGGVVVAVGGRDVIPGETTPLCSDVGRFTRAGKLVGNHHLGFGEARPVDVLKGANMAFAANALAIPRAGTLRGDGAQAHFEILCCLWARRVGAVTYDPAILVDHRPRERFDADQRRRPTASAILDAAHNFLVASTLLDRRLVARRAAYCLFVGNRANPGLLRTVTAAMRGERDVVRRAVPSLAGYALALARVAFAPPAAPMHACESLRLSPVQRSIA